MEPPIERYALSPLNLLANSATPDECSEPPPYLDTRTASHIQHLYSACIYFYSCLDALCSTASFTKVVWTCWETLRISDSPDVQGWWSSRENTCRIFPAIRVLISQIHTTFRILKLMASYFVQLSILQYGSASTETLRKMTSSTLIIFPRPPMPSIRNSRCSVHLVTLRYLSNQSCITRPFASCEVPGICTAQWQHHVTRGLCSGWASGHDIKHVTLTPTSAPLSTSFIAQGSETQPVSKCQWEVTGYRLLFCTYIHMLCHLTSLTLWTVVTACMPPGILSMPPLRVK